jgi:hypothetical protein
MQKSMEFDSQKKAANIINLSPLIRGVSTGAFSLCIYDNRLVVKGRFSHGGLGNGHPVAVMDAQGHVRQFGVHHQGRLR